jgi:hypothetical protein
MDSGTRITGGGSGYAALLAHAGGALYGTELGSVTLKRISFFCFPIKHSTHTRGNEQLCHFSRVGDMRPDLVSLWYIYIMYMCICTTHTNYVCVVLAHDASEHVRGPGRSI